METKTNKSEILNRRQINRIGRAVKMLKSGNSIEEVASELNLKESDIRVLEQIEK